MVDYEINEETYAIIPYKNNKSKVIESSKTFIVDNLVSEIMENSCEYFGSSMNGRIQGTNNLIGVTHKAPIIVEETKEIIFFPTASPRLPKCSWISLKNIEKYYRENEKIIIEFKNKTQIKLDISYGIIDNQILRATRLESVLRKRKTLK